MTIISFKFSFTSDKTIIKPATPITKIISINNLELQQKLFFTFTFAWTEIFLLKSLTKKVLFFL